MIFRSAIAIFLSSAVLIGCSVENDPFANQPVAELDSSIMILTSEGSNGTVEGAEISPDGKIILDHGAHERVLNGKKENYQQVVSLLAPLRGFSGTQGNRENWGETIECDRQTKDNTVATILWKPEASVEAKGNVSEFFFNCRSLKSDAAKRRIESAIKLIDMEIERVEKSSNAS